MTPEEIKPGHTYECIGNPNCLVLAVVADSVTYRDCYGVAESGLANFARYAVRDVTPAPESGHGEKVAQAQSQGASRGRGVAELTADDWLQIEMAAKGCVSGRSNEWPALVAAINKIRSQPLSRPMSAAWLQGFCEAVIASRCVPPAAVVNAELLESLHGLLDVLPSATTHPAIKAARAAIAKAEAANDPPRFRHRRTGDIYELLLIANEHAERTAQYPPTAVYRRVSDQTVWSRPVQDWGKDFYEVSGE